MRLALRCQQDCAAVIGLQDSVDKPIRSKSKEEATMFDFIQNLTNMLPVAMHVSPITVAGAGVAAIAFSIYCITRSPEMLLVVLTAMAYAIVPVLSQLA
jgi:hypothetical protein